MLGMPRSKYQVIAALFDIKPVNENGEINVEKISNVEPLLNLGRKLRIGKSGQPSLTSSIKNKESSIKPEKPSGPRAFTGYKKPEPVIEKPEIQNTKYEIL